jgi:hypothetical protein
LSEIINLRQARKQKTRERKQAVAAQNRVVLGRLKAEQRLVEAERALSDASLEAHRIVRPDAD